MHKKTDTYLTSPPLLSWDIFMNGYNKRMALANDFNQLNKLSISEKWIIEWDMEAKLFQEGKIIIVTDPSLHIVYTGGNIFEMNGYTPAELIGKSPKIFQGPDTSIETLLKIRGAINSRKAIDITVLNYKKNKQTYYCHVQEYPVFNKNRELSHFIAFENIPPVPST
jgi:PAS domain S-box-containing protein